MFLKNENLNTKYEAVLAASGGKSLRQQAWERLQTEGLPSLKTDAWKYTNLALLNKQAIEFVNEDGLDVGGFDAPVELAECYVVKFINGRLLEDSVSAELASKLKISAINEGELKQEVVLENSQSSFDLLNTATFDRGTQITVAADTSIDKPIALVNLTNSSTELMSGYNSRVEIQCEAGSKAQFIEWSMSATKTPSFSNAVTLIQVDENASATYLKVQHEMAESVHMHFLCSELQKGSNFNAFNLSTGCKLNRNNLTVRLLGEQAAVNVNGLYLTKGEQVIDNRTIIEHAAPHTTSDQLYKGVLDDKSRGVFNGVVKINKDAQKVDSSQLNKNLILSNKAEADSKPELQVFADDVKANHGSAIGELDTSEIFYFQSRGISKQMAEKMLTRGFLQEAAFKIDHEQVRSVAMKSIDSVMQSYFLESADADK